MQLKIIFKLRFLKVHNIIYSGTNVTYTNTQHLINYLLPSTYLIHNPSKPNIYFLDHSQVS